MLTRIAGKIVLSDNPVFRKVSRQVSRPGRSPSVRRAFTAWSPGGSGGSNGSDGFKWLGRLGLGQLVGWLIGKEKRKK